MAPRAEGSEQRKMLPPFFFRESMQPGQTVTKAQFEQIAKGAFDEMDKNHDGLLSREESRPPRPVGPNARPEGAPQAPPPPNAQFIGAELRFGDKLVVNKPFSADIVIQVASAFDRAVVAAALGLPTCELIGSVSNPLRESTGTVVHDLGEFSVAAYGPASDREPAAAVKAGA